MDVESKHECYTRVTRVPHCSFHSIDHCRQNAETCKGEESKFVEGIFASSFLCWRRTLLPGVLCSLQVSKPTFTSQSVMTMRGYTSLILSPLRLGTMLCLGREVAEKRHPYLESKLNKQNHHILTPNHTNSLRY